MDSCPRELKPYDIAHKKKIMEQDYLQHLWWGNYGISALYVAIEGCLAGKKSKAKYIEKPLFASIEEEKVKQRELFVAGLMAMKTNFELNHVKESDVE